jgi:hypothetical protein
MRNRYRLSGNTKRNCLNCASRHRQKSNPASHVGNRSCRRNLDRTSWWSVAATLVYSARAGTVNLRCPLISGPSPPGRMIRPSHVLTGDAIVIRSKFTSASGDIANAATISRPEIGRRMRSNSSGRTTTMASQPCSVTRWQLRHRPGNSVPTKPIALLRSA